MTDLHTNISVVCMFVYRSSCYFFKKNVRLSIIQLCKRPVYYMYMHTCNAILQSDCIYVYTAAAHDVYLEMFVFTIHCF